MLSLAPEVPLWAAIDGRRIAGYGTVGPDRSPRAALDAHELYALYVGTKGAHVA